MLLTFYWQGQLDVSSVFDFVASIVVAAIFAVIAFIANVIIFDQLFRVSEGEKNHLEYLKKKLEDMEE
jgi:hypothetical protein